MDDEGDDFGLDEESEERHEKAAINAASEEAEEMSPLASAFRLCSGNAARPPPLRCVAEEEEDKDSDYSESGRSSFSENEDSQSDRGEAGELAARRPDVPRHSSLPPITKNVAAQEAKKDRVSLLRMKGVSHIFRPDKPGKRASEAKVKRHVVKPPLEQEVRKNPRRRRDSRTDITDVTVDRICDKDMQAAQAFMRRQSFANAADVMHASWSRATRCFSEAQRKKDELAEDHRLMEEDARGQAVIGTGIFSSPTSAPSSPRKPDGAMSGSCSLSPSQSRYEASPSPCGLPLVTPPGSSAASGGLRRSLASPKQGSKPRTTPASNWLAARRGSGLRSPRSDPSSTGSGGERVVAVVEEVRSRQSVERISRFNRRSGLGLPKKEEPRELPALLNVGSTVWELAPASVLGKLTQLGMNLTLSYVRLRQWGKVEDLALQTIATLRAKAAAMQHSENSFHRVKRSEGFARIMQDSGPPIGEEERWMTLKVSLGVACASLDHRRMEESAKHFNDVMKFAPRHRPAKRGYELVRFLQTQLGPGSESKRWKEQELHDSGCGSMPVREVTDGTHYKLQWDSATKWFVPETERAVNEEMRSSALNSLANLV
eukprot:TRINITY_DN12076_c0_g2_i1.p1 TRINITY_DN12076_c0_g2~~TRINITY_DN12076_c0_g2_i1.p1  ORF type:complete len:601 (-),score=122.40 TRINITY_DN12076_c0_g2_i1:139-1941(-)